MWRIRGKGIIVPLGTLGRRILWTSASKVERDPWHELTCGLNGLRMFIKEKEGKQTVLKECLLLFHSALKL